MTSFPQIAPSSLERTQSTTNIRTELEFFQQDAKGNVTTGALKRLSDLPKSPFTLENYTQYAENWALSQMTKQNNPKKFSAVLRIFTNDEIFLTKKYTPDQNSET